MCTLATWARPEARWLYKLHSPSRVCVCCINLHCNHAVSEECSECALYNSVRVRSDRQRTSLLFGEELSGRRFQSTQ